MSIVVSSIVNLINKMLGHLEAIRMVLSHSQNSDIRIHVRGSAHNKLIILERDPVRHVLIEGHLGVQVNTTVVPEGHPSPNVGFESLWSKQFKSFVSCKTPISRT